MTFKTLGLPIVFASLSFLVAPALAQSDAAEDAFLTRIDQARALHNPQFWEVEITNKFYGTKVLATANLWFKDEKRRLDILSPATIAKTRLLMLSPTQIFSFSPSDGRVRPIAGHQPAAIASSLWDLRENLTALAPFFSATIQKSRPTEIVLTATLKPGPTRKYAKLEITAEPSTGQLRKIVYFKATGVAALSEDYFYGTVDNKLVLKSLTLTDLTQPDVQTLVTIKLQKSVSIPEEVFSQRALQN